MRFLLLCLCFTFLAGAGIHAQQTGVELPDYAKWVKTLDHSETYLYKDKDVQLRDQHYRLNEASKRSLILVYFHPEDSNKMWFAVYVTINAGGAPSGSLFDRKDELWSFVQNLSQDDLDNIAMLFKSRYGLEYKEK